jgi:isopentenyldiphosphate isomerase
VVSTKGTLVPAQDPTELFDLYDVDGRPLGRAKPRALVHRDGDWHRSLHVWVVLKGTEPLPELLLQRRSLAKDTQPGAVDIAVAGHLAAGETVEDGLREAEEEIGLVLCPADVTRLGVRRRVFAAPSVLDREIQEVFFTVTSRPFTSLVPHPDELAALLTLPLEGALALASGRVAEAPARELPVGQGVVREVVLRGPDLLADRDGYFVLALRSILEHLEGRPDPPWDLGGRPP